MGGCRLQKILAWVSAPRDWSILHCLESAWHEHKRVCVMGIDTASYFDDLDFYLRIFFLFGV